MTTKSKVAVVKGDNPQKMIENALSLLGDITEIIPLGRKIILKPNAGHASGPETAVNTSPEFLRGVIRVVKKTNPTEIILAESSAVGEKTMKCFKISGLMKVAEEEGVDRIVDLKSYKPLIRKPIDIPSSEIDYVDLPDILLNDEYFFINLPIFKSHTSMVYSCAMKNLKGIVQDRHHIIMHATNLVGSLADLNELIQPDLTIVDMINPQEGFGPHAGTPVHVGCVLAGTDTLAIDVVACKIASLPLDRIEYFPDMAGRNIGNYKDEDIELLGEPIENVKKKLYLPYLEGFKIFPEYKVHVGKACSSCQGLVSFNIVRLKSLGKYEELSGSQIITGTLRDKKVPAEFDLNKPIFLMGQCGIKNQKFLEEAGAKKIYRVFGCPPGEPTLSWTMMDRKEWDTRAINKKNLSLLDKLRLAPMVVKVRARMAFETKLFMRWLENQKKAE
ncbi:MAG: hypothetical protein CVV44_11265 [Spirochaetae bacterium HGW-Spirochaetae-1]|jgi:uncharacterized protein (DUF362 family)|nr:MAG: hypothetical protein CVV44_11265 [Spirochaetae bacterium HGW-Spirochaetae-1]